MLCTPCCCRPHGAGFVRDQRGDGPAVDQAPQLHARSAPARDAGGRWGGGEGHLHGEFCHDKFGWEPALYCTLHLNILSDLHTRATFFSQDRTPTPTDTAPDDDMICAPASTDLCIIHAPQVPSLKHLKQRQTSNQIRVEPAPIAPCPTWPLARPPSPPTPLRQPASASCPHPPALAHHRLPQVKLHKWLQGADMALLQGFVRPGCTQLVLDLLANPAGPGPGPGPGPAEAADIAAAAAAPGAGAEHVRVSLLVN